MSNSEVIVTALETLLLERAWSRSADGRSLDALYESSLAFAMDAAIATAFFPRRPLPSSDAIAILKSAISSIEVSALASMLGEAFEQMRGRKLVRARGERIGLESSSDRRSNGIYYTPSHLAETIAKPAVSHAMKGVESLRDLKRVKILDPAAGCGSFLLAALRASVEILQERKAFKRFSITELRTHVAANCIFGIDIDPIAIATTRALLLGEVANQQWKGSELESHLKVGDAVSVPFSHWQQWFPSAFPGGFSAVITNPPWSKLRPLRHEFFEHIDTKVRAYQGTQLGAYLQTHLRDLVDGAWTDYAARTMALSASLRSSSEYTINADNSGDADLYKYFTERALTLLNDGGVAALLLPSGLLRAQGSSTLRRLLRSHGRVQTLVEYINKKKLFDIHSMYRFCSVHFIKGRPGGIDRATFGKVTVENDCGHVKLTKNYLSIVGGKDLLIPEVRTEQERDLLLRLYQLFPRPGATGSGWKFNFRRELDMTNDSAHFLAAEHVHSQVAKHIGKTPTATSGRLLPLYEGRMVHQFDNTAKAYEAGHGRSAIWRASPPNSRNVAPHYFVNEDYAGKKGWRESLRAGYCEISGHANERTVLACLIPASSVCGNKVPVLQPETSDLSTHLLWISLANSLVVDWMMRRWVSTTVNQFYWQNIPLPPRGSTSSAERLLIDAAKKLHAPSQRNDTSALLGQRALLRAVIDATVLDLYQVSDRELVLILEDFPQFSVANRRGPAGSEAITALLVKARRALRRGLVDISGNLESAIGCSADLAAAAYTPRSQSEYLTAAGRGGKAATTRRRKGRLEST